MFKNKSLRLAIVLTLFFLVSGFALLHVGWVEYAFVFFLLLPILIGISIGALPSRTWALLGLALTLILTLAGLIMMGLEGALCGIMALGILLPCLLIGALLGKLISNVFKDKGTTNLKLLSAPFLIFLFAVPVENMLITEPEKIASTTEVILPYTPDQVFDAIKSIDTLVAPKSSLMYLGLPVPYKCRLDKEAVGAKRTCYFAGGTIEQEVTVFSPGKELRMVVTNYQLTGRKWLGFKDAAYLFEALPQGGTKLTRITTYTSELRPRLYWQPLEEMGIQQEHAYVFTSLHQILKDKHGPGPQK